MMVPWIANATSHLHGPRWWGREGMFWPDGRTLSKRQLDPKPERVWFYDQSIWEVKPPAPDELAPGEW